jgi:hypothetical protein
MPNYITPCVMLSRVFPKVFLIIFTGFGVRSERVADSAHMRQKEEAPQTHCLRDFSGLGERI